MSAANPETPSKVFIDLLAMETEVVVAAEEKTRDVLQGVAEEEGTDPRRPFKRPRETLGSTSTSTLVCLVHVDPCSDVPLRRVPAAVHENMAHYARPCSWARILLLMRGRWWALQQLGRTCSERSRSSGYRGRRRGILPTWPSTI